MSRARAARGPVRGANTPILMGALVSAAGAAGAQIIATVTALRRVKTPTVKSREYLRWCMLPPFYEGISWLFHIPSDFVVDPWVSDVESRSRLDCRFLHSVETTFGCLMSAKITSATSMA